MAADLQTQSLEARIRELEAQVAKLREHVVALEKRLASQPEHSVDQRMTRSKVVYDWQA
jgi:uncharacterized coiled-coil protein SlyX